MLPRSPRAFRLFQRGGYLFVINIADALEEERREDISFEVGSVNGAAQDVGGLPEV